MSRRRARLLGFLLVAPLAGANAQCGPRVVDAVDLAQAPDGGPGYIWPAATSGANSDPWLVEHHDSLVEMRPRLLVLDFYNHLDMQQAEQKILEKRDAIAESSRYHGYADPAAFAFLQYDLVKLVDLTDHPPSPTWPFESSSLLPTDAAGAFDAGALFSPAFARNYGFFDPTNPSRPLGLCELFERGLINELWLMTGDEGSSRRPPLMAESKQVYDAQNHAVVGMFEDTGYQPFPALHCNVTARIAYVSPLRGVDCDLVPRSAGIENTASASLPAIPYLTASASGFFNDDFRARNGTPFNSWAELVAEGTGGWCSSEQTACIAYPSETAVPTPVPAAEGTFPDGATWKMVPFTQGCGTAHFPPNARFEWDYGNAQAVRSRCEHYGMKDGPGGDVLDAYRSDKTSVATYTQRFGDDGCGGGWQVYLRQSMPGLHNLARAADGSRMKNWWPFLFY
jgi:hypothetical protein